MSKHILIQLSQTDKKELEQFSTTGVHSVRLVNRAKIILALGKSNDCEKRTQAAIAADVGVSRQTVINVMNDFLTAESVSAFLQRKKRSTPPVTPKVTGELEAHVIALACSEAPEGRAKWTLQLLADKCVELGYVDSLSNMTVSRLLKKQNLSLT